MTGLSRTPPKDMEKERLAKALRDNLKRRKAQARERAAEPATEPPAKAGETAAAADISGKS